MRRARRDMDASAFDATPLELEDSDPMASTSNLVDAMLVFACGLMLSLIVRYNVDLASVQDVDITQDLSEVENIDTMAQDLQSGGAGYTELGTVYQDPATGKMYMVVEGETAEQSEIAGSGDGDDEAARNARANGAD